MIRTCQTHCSKRWLSVLSVCYSGALLFVLAVGMNTQAALAAEASADSVRDLLRHQHPVWYDSERDDWKRVAIPAPLKEQAKADSRSAFAIGGTILWIMLIVVMSTAAWLLWQLLRHLRISAAIQPAAIQRSVSGHVTDVSALPFDHADADPEPALAQALAAHDWSRAVIWLYAAFLLRLDRASVIRLHKSSTNRHYARVVADWIGTRPARTPVGEAMNAGIDAF